MSCADIMLYINAILYILKKRIPLLHATQPLSLSVCRLYLLLTFSYPAVWYCVLGQSCPPFVCFSCGVFNSQEGEGADPAVRYNMLYHAMLCCSILRCTIQYYVILYYTMFCYTILYRTILYSTVLCNIALCCALLCCTVLLGSNLLCSNISSSTLLYSTLLYCTLSCSTLLLSTPQCSSILFSNLLHFPCSSFIPLFSFVVLPHFFSLYSSSQCWRIGGWA